MQLQTKSVIEHDLSSIRIQRAERERKANTAFAKVPVDEGNIDHNSATGIAEEDATNQVEVPHGEDVAMTDVLIQSALQGADSSAPITALQAAGTQQAINAVQSMPQDSENSSGLAITIPAGSTNKTEDTTKTADVKETPSRGATNVVSHGDQPLETPKTNNFDFESMFNDADLVAADGTMNFNLDFSASDNNTLNVLDGGFEDITMSNPDLANGGPTTNEDINTLLPGLESYVNAGDMIGDASVPVASMLPVASQAAVPDAVTSAAMASTESVAIDSSFDDFFTNGDFVATGGEGNNDLIGDGNFEGFEKFDDDWFEM